MLSRDGARLDGVDRFFTSGGRSASGRTRDLVALRFHLHPDVRLAGDDAGRLVAESPRGGEWTFSCDDVEPSVEESIFFAGLAGPQRSHQIVLNFRASEAPEIAWTLMRTRQAAPV